MLKNKIYSTVLIIVFFSLSILIQNIIYKNKHSNFNNFKIQYNIPPSNKKTRDINLKLKKIKTQNQISSSKIKEFMNYSNKKPLLIKEKKRNNSKQNQNKKTKIATLNIKILGIIRHKNNNEVLLKIDNKILKLKSGDEFKNCFKIISINKNKIKVKFKDEIKEYKI